MRAGIRRWGLGAALVAVASLGALRAATTDAPRTETTSICETSHRPEYKVIEIKPLPFFGGFLGNVFKPQRFETFLNDQAGQGWRLVSLGHFGDSTNGDYYGVFERIQ